MNYTYESVCSIFILINLLSSHEEPEISKGETRRGVRANNLSGGRGVWCVEDMMAVLERPFGPYKIVM